LAEALLKRGDHVTVVDDLSTGSIRNIRHLKDEPRFSHVIGNVRNTRLLAELVDDADQVYHLAAAVGVRLIVESPVRTIETNLKGTEVVLAAAAKKKKKVFLASTSEVYGKSVDVPFREDGDLVLGSTKRGRWSYACSKAVDEFLAIAYWRERHCPTLIGRFFNTVGPRQTGQYGMVVPRFAGQALHQEPLTVYGDGQQSRCFTHVSDAVGAAIALMDVDHTVGEVFNIGSQEEISMVELAGRIRELANSSSEIVFVPYAEAFGENFEDMPRRVPSLDKIRAAIAYEPRMGLRETLQSVISYCRSLEPTAALRS
ncbi:MAG: nucleoside-diphosphate sugar epimerase, partial [Gemmatimonadetes bacterium 13_1_40CM_2_60_3]